MIENKKILRGGHFLLESSNPADVFIPEDMSEEQEMIKETCQSFNDTVHAPAREAYEDQPEGLASELMASLGELGMLGTHMPEEYGGLDLDFISNTIIAEMMGTTGSFSVTYNAHTGIGMLPILYFGTKDQKEKYLPDMLTGQKVGSYCLTEPSSGSDALSAKTTAVLNEDGTKYILNGQKMWISNAGLAEVFIVFAKIDGEHFTGFIADKDTPGMTLGEEEKKMGIKGSSTRMVFLENAEIPVENLLGEIGKGHLIAFNVLNVGRYKLGASALGGAKYVADLSVKYAIEREQFKQPIANFGAIQYKLAEQAIKIFGLESSIYRVAGLLDDAIKRSKKDGASFEGSKLSSAEEYALECSIIKVLGSEVLDYCADEAVQVYGGMGFSEESMVARAYRDSRINRIFEGTNEINRLLIGNILFKRAKKGNFDLATQAMKVQGKLMSGQSEIPEGNLWLVDETKASQQLKDLTIMLMGLAGQKAMAGKLDLRDEQEILMNLADLVMLSHTLESSLLRAQKMKSTGTDVDIASKMVKVICQDSLLQAYTTAMNTVIDLADENMLSMVIKGIKTLTKYPVQPIKQYRRDIAKSLIAKHS